ncbi:unnamed protein product [Polarella glacialis]|uniref:RanBP-type and C3HC4-type zinc finger-containing protein 1 n=3 Tax=Polarella glacialis TaxID=89957 RepID=A0A813DSA9_POLGL|nr:unnamed protein product [Polarella glacialis]
MKGRATTVAQTCDESPWACPDCTLRNRGSAEQCEVCAAARPGSWSCAGCTLANTQRAENCAACGQLRPPRRRPKKGEAWRPADHLIAAGTGRTTGAGRGYAPAVSSSRPQLQRLQQQPVRRGDFVRGSCRLILDAAAEGDYSGHGLWQKVWRVDMACEELPACPICLEEPSLPRVPQCGHVLCLQCALRHLQAAQATPSACSCPVCGKGPLLLEDLRTVRVELQQLPKPGEKPDIEFQLVRRVGDFHVGLPSEGDGCDTGLPCEGAPGWNFARRVRGDPEARLDLLRAELRELEAELALEQSSNNNSSSNNNNSKSSQDPKVSCVIAQLLSPALTLLRQQLGHAAAAAAVAEARRGNSNNNNNNNSSRSTQRQQPAGGEQDKQTVVFYQSTDGQLIFLEPWLTKQLLGTYGCWGSLPAKVRLKPLKTLRQEAVTEELKRRHRFLAHLPAESAGNLVFFADGFLVAGEAKGKGRGKATSRKSPEAGAQRQQFDSRPAGPAADDNNDDDNNYNKHNNMHNKNNNQNNNNNNNINDNSNDESSAATDTGQPSTESPAEATIRADGWSDDD